MRKKLELRKESHRGKVKEELREDSEKIHKGGTCGDEKIIEKKRKEKKRKEKKGKERKGKERKRKEKKRKEKK